MLLILGLHQLITIAQSPFGFTRDLLVQLEDSASRKFKNAWAGGMNAPQFGEIDLNMDGLSDLFVFDRSGNKILPFLRDADRKIIRYAPEFENNFPMLANWALLRDYNKDGRQDIFTSASQGIRVFKNISQGSGEPKFELASDLLYSNYGNGFLNLFVSQQDLPAIDDVDGDGDLDIITFYILGDCVEYHQNLSQEMNGNADSLIFKRKSDNWGLFTEDRFSNGVYLNDSCDKTTGGTRHNGSTLLIQDLDQDLDPDLLLGDVAYANLQVLINDQKEKKDIIISTPADYPETYRKFSLESFPAAYRLHLNEDDLPDLVIAPNTDDYAISNDSLSIGYPSLPGKFSFTAPPAPFLASEMPDLGKNSYPCLSDLDADGDADLIIGNYGEYIPSGKTDEPGEYQASLWLFENTGNNREAVFKLKTKDLGNLRNMNLQHLAPAATDLSGDGMPDLLIGRSNGGFMYLMQTGKKGDFTFATQSGIFNSLNTGLFCVPAIADLNQDGLQDIICGNRSGIFNYFKNIGTKSSPDYSINPTIEAMGNIETVDEKTSNTGYSAPCIFYDDGVPYLFSGSESGRLYLWELPENLHESNYNLLDSAIANLDEGSFSSLAVFDTDVDGGPDIITGNKRGGIAFYRGSKVNSITGLSEDSIRLYPNPTGGMVYIDGMQNNPDVQMLLRDISGRKLMEPEKTDHITLEHFSSGVYILQIITDNSSISLKVLKN